MRREFQFNSEWNSPEMKGEWQREIKKPEEEKWDEKEYKEVELKLDLKGFEIKDKDFIRTYHPENTGTAYNTRLYIGELIDYLKHLEPEYRENFKHELSEAFDGNEEKTEEFIEYLKDQDKIVIKRLEL